VKQLSKNIKLKPQIVINKNLIKYYFLLLDILLSYVVIFVFIISYIVYLFIAVHAQEILSQKTTSNLHSDFCQQKNKIYTENKYTPINH
jgi:hypothetical protein